MATDQQTTKVLRALTWSGPWMIANLLICMVVARFIPPPSPAKSAVQIDALFVDHRNAIIGACILMMFGWLAWATFCPAIMTVLRPAEGIRPAITYTSIALIGGGMVFFELIPMVWCVAAFRAGEISPEIIRTLNDFAWFSFLFSAPPFLVWFVLLAYAILTDDRPTGAYPRWVAYVNLWLAVIALPACFIGFFKHGPLAWNGLLAFYIPVGAFVGWFAVMTVTTLRAISERATATT